jgi:hypothetical protein
MTVGALVAVVLAMAPLGLVLRPGPPAPRPAPVAEVPSGKPSAPPAPAPVAKAWTVELDGVAEVPPARRRTTTVDLLPIHGKPQRVSVVYDREAVAGPTTLEALPTKPEWVSGVRLLLGEVGAWRLKTGRWSLLEGVGILETVGNRFEPDLANPLRKRGVAAWPGCGPGGTFATCIDPAQYVGMASDRALRPRDAVPDEAVLLAGMDVAVAAWYVYEEALLGEITAGATSFVHLCGGAAYGKPSSGCAEAGGDPNRGPALFRGPSAWNKAQGRYTLSALAVVDFADGAPPTASKAYVQYLLAADVSPYAGP